ncbi:uncharacterized protein KQ657_001312 [Scheffersomyces spartinae]|uniref:FAS1 domain-containing protein n=1 Tax=Scheffersomyces spartinae TaxID=45513 RepID=A0A9P7V7X1_9ASCO|nr:uncharacterized protein KQ657_001312 [Scheffersomyces spartinae]KAG7192855.1 hypothetical protein KQ657_001312 [Scheffersomyces spartinae]
MKSSFGVAACLTVAVVAQAAAIGTELEPQLVNREGDSEIEVAYGTISKREEDDIVEEPVQIFYGSGTISKRAEDDVLLTVVKRDAAEYGIFVRKRDDGSEEIVVSSLVSRKEDEDAEAHFSVEVFKRAVDDENLVYDFGANNQAEPLIEFTINKRGDVSVVSDPAVATAYAVYSKRGDLEALTAIGKREPKNVVDIHKFVPTKREAKNVVDIHRLVPTKREAKNVVDIHKFIPVKREPKNVVDLKKLITKRDSSDSNDIPVVYATISKRDLSFVPSIEDVLSSLVQRTQQLLQVGTETVSTKADDDFIGDGETSAINTLLDTMPKLTIFANYLRDFDVAELNVAHQNVKRSKHCKGHHKKLMKQNKSKNDHTFVFAPLDLAFDKYTKKPWEYPLAVDTEEDAKHNLNDFIKAHIALGHKLKLEHNYMDNKVSVEDSKVFIDGVQQAKVIEIKRATGLEDYVIVVVDDILVKP